MMDLVYIDKMDDDGYLVNKMTTLEDKAPPMLTCLSIHQQLWINRGLTLGG